MKDKPLLASIVWWELAIVANTGWLILSGSLSDHETWELENDHWWLNTLVTYTGVSLLVTYTGVILVTYTGGSLVTYILV